MLKKNSSSSLFITLFIFSFALLVQPSYQIQRFRRYVYVPDKMTWSNAQKYCREHHTDLATISHIREYKEAWTECGSEQNCWIGLQKADNDLDGWLWSDGWAITYTFWQEDEPNNIRGNENCVAMFSKLWYDIPCNDKYPFLCYEDNLILVRESKKWEEALQHCRTLDMEPGSNNTDTDPLYDLPSFPDLESENVYPRFRVQDALTDKVWVGLRFLAGHWLWLNGKPVKNELPVCPAPGMYCGTMSKTGKLFQLSNCLERRNFFCWLKK